MKRFFEVGLSPSLMPKVTRRLMSHYFEGSSLEKYYRVSLTTEIKAILEEIDYRKREIQAYQSQTNGNLKDAIHEKLRFIWTYNSNAIEGSKLSLGDTIFFLQEGLTVDGKPFKDFVDAKNHSQAIDYLYEVVRKEYPLDSHFLCALNAILLKGVESTPAKDMFGNMFQKKMNAGAYKTEENYVQQPDGTIHRYVEPHLVPAQIDGLCSWINANPDNQHPVVLAAIAHYNQVRIHPFQDGNGRGSRILKNLILLRESYTPAIIEAVKRREYIASLKVADQGNLIPTIEFVANSVKKTQILILDEIKQNIATKIIEYKQ